LLRHETLAVTPRPDGIPRDRVFHWQGFAPFGLTIVPSRKPRYASVNLAAAESCRSNACDLCSLRPSSIQHSRHADAFSVPQPARPRIRDAGMPLLVSARDARRGFGSRTSVRGKNSPMYGNLRNNDREKARLRRRGAPTHSPRDASHRRVDRGTFGRVVVARVASGRACRMSR